MKLIKAIIGLGCSLLISINLFSASVNSKNLMNWSRFTEYYYHSPDLTFSMDISRMHFQDAFFDDMHSEIQKAFKAMDALEEGMIANPDEGRMVGHYWLRDSSLAPTPELKADIDNALSSIKDFSNKVHNNSVKGAQGAFKNLLVVGIGGSALGPQFVSQALSSPKEDKLNLFFIDNTDPDGIDQTFAKLEGELGQTLVVVISKSGGTKETRNGMLETKAAYEKAGLDFAKHAVAITGEGSLLDNIAQTEGWLQRFPLWDWVGGRTSELATVGLVPAALQGISIDQMLEGAKYMDQLTREKDPKNNPAALLALMWYQATRGKGEKDMVILPYKDRLELFSKYLQQLVMESLGKGKDLSGEIVNQGIAVYGNKGSTDQHAYVQQLREGINNFFVTFIEVLKDRQTNSMEVEPGTTSGEYLQGFLLGTRDALSENMRESITITIDEVSPRSVGALIALYERAVGFYANLVNINAYHQPGVEAGKKAATATLELKTKIVDFLTRNPNQPFIAETLAEQLNAQDQVELVFKLLEHLAANSNKPVSKKACNPFYKSQYTYSPSA